MDTVALQSRKNSDSLFMRSWLSWQSPVPKLGKQECKLCYTLITFSCVLFAWCFIQNRRAEVFPLTKYPEEKLILSLVHLIFDPSTG